MKEIDSLFRCCDTVYHILIRAVVDYLWYTLIKHILKYLKNNGFVILGYTFKINISSI